MYKVITMLSIALAGPAMACGTDSDCALGNRVYRIVEADRPGFGALIFFHGVGGSAAGTMANEALREFAEREDLALVAAEAALDDWNIPGSPTTYQADAVDELAYFDALLEKLEQETEIDLTRMFVAGFSAGAMVVWTLACHRSDAVAGFIPVSGTFWEPLPGQCGSLDADLIHYHGRQDDVVPMQGRPVADSHQGDLDVAFALMAQTSEFGTSISQERSELSCERRESETGQRLELCTFAGGHQFQVGFLQDAFLQLSANRPNRN